MSTHSNWAAILAGGDGQRLRSFTRVLTGDERPKQFCRLFGSHTLLSETRNRLCLNVEPSRTLYVVTRTHEAFYRQELADVRQWQLVEQPANRGTTAAVAATVVRRRSIGADGVMGIFTADHYKRDVLPHQRTVACEYALSAANPHSVVLIGAEPDNPETEYGWIEPGYRIELDGRGMARGTMVRAVRQFCEKPKIEVARDLLARRCLWNTMIVIGRIHAFETLLQAAVPDVWEEFATLGTASTPLAEAQQAEELYRRLGASDFSRDVLARQPDRLTVVNLPDAGWTDLGQPDRVMDIIGRQPQAPAHVEQRLADS
jgi:mannose-1-phosphate guanylyltransferase